jgi:hypothetical protein
LRSDVDLTTLTREQLIARVQIAQSEAARLQENNNHLHRMMEVLRDNGWATPRPADGLPRHVEIKRYPGMGAQFQQPPERSDLAKKLQEANERADHWRKRYMELLDQTGRAR